MNRLNDMMHEPRQKIKSKLSSNSQNWLEKEFLTKTPKKIPLDFFFKEIDQLIIT